MVYKIEKQSNLSKTDKKKLKQGNGKGEKRGKSSKVDESQKASKKKAK